MFTKSVAKIQSDTDQEGEAISLYNVGHTALFSLLLRLRFCSISHGFMTERKILVPFIIEALFA